MKSTIRAGLDQIAQCLDWSIQWYRRHWSAIAWVSLPLSGAVGCWIAWLCWDDRAYFLPASYLNLIWPFIGVSPGIQQTERASLALYIIALQKVIDFVVVQVLVSIKLHKITGIDMIDIAKPFRKIIPLLIMICVGVALQIINAYLFAFLISMCIVIHRNIAISINNSVMLDWTYLLPGLFFLLLTAAGLVVGLAYNFSFLIGFQNMLNPHDQTYRIQLRSIPTHTIPVYGLALLCVELFLSITALTLILIAAIGLYTLGPLAGITTAVEIQILLLGPAAAVVFSLLSPLRYVFAYRWAQLEHVYTAGTECVNTC